MIVLCYQKGASTREINRCGPGRLQILNVHQSGVQQASLYTFVKRLTRLCLAARRHTNSGLTASFFGTGSARTRTYSGKAQRPQ